MERSGGNHDTTPPPPFAYLISLIVLHWWRLFPGFPCMRWARWHGEGGNLDARCGSRTQSAT